ncbi:MAG: phosphate/phosphite/phosphonate ABC transporter substrate-binding protein [Chloroflexota bacterium]
MATNLPERDNQPWHSHLVFAAALVLFLLLLAGCHAGESAPVITLSQLEPLPASPSEEVVPLRVAVAAIISPQGTVDSYTSLLNYLSEQIDRPVELVQRRTYTEINDLIARGEVDLAFVCTGAYVEGHRDFGMQLLAAPGVQGEVVYYSQLIVPAHSDVQNLDDLRGAVFAFTDPISTSGRNYPISLLQQSGETPDSFFARTFYTYSHDDAIRAVAGGVADGAAVDSLVYAYALEREPELGEQTRVIHTSPAFGMPPVVTGPHTRPQLAAELQAILLDMHDNPEGREALAAAGIDSFVTIDDAAYDSVRRLVETINE